MKTLLLIILFLQGFLVAQHFFFPTIPKFYPICLEITRLRDTATTKARWEEFKMKAPDTVNMCMEE